MIIDKDNIKLILIILVVSLGIGYAYINSDLNINGTAKIKTANWDVHWANIQVTNGSVSGTNVVTAPTISNSTTVNFSVVLPTPGDYYEFTVDAVNAGVIDAMIDTIDSKLNGATITTLPDYLEYKVTYSNGVELEETHELLANTTETYKVKVKYRDDIELNQIPASDQTLSLSFTVTYRQANEEAEAVDHNTYVYYNGSASINSTNYESATEDYQELDRNIFLRCKVEEDRVTGIDIGFIYNDNTYFLKGDETGEGYEKNKATMNRAFGSNNCSEELNGTTKSYSCTVDGDLYSFRQAYSDSTGLISAAIGDYGCTYDGGSAGCGSGYY